MPAIENLSANFQRYTIRGVGFYKIFVDHTAQENAKKLGKKQENSIIDFLFLCLLVELNFAEIIFDKKDRNYQQSSFFIIYLCGWSFIKLYIILMGN